jgi:hypothetical protein
MSEPRLLAASEGPDRMGLGPDGPGPAGPD